MKAIAWASIHVLLLVLLAAVCAAEPVASSAKPNIVLILLDDFGYENVTANGGESYQTPVMDRLTETGVRFDQCHVQPLCTPTRVELMTGLSNQRNYANFGAMDPTQRTFGNLLKDAGYATCIAGKWQLGNGYDGPGLFGFDEYALWHLFQKTPRYKHPRLDINGQRYHYTNGEYGPDIVSDFVLDFITRKKDGPFFVYYPMMLTHSPFDATPDSEDYLEGNDAEGDKSGSGHFADMVAYADKLIGRVVDRLDELKLRDSTLVLILGDNGTARSVHTRFRGRIVRGGKGTTTTWGTHVPCIGNWPGRFANGKVCDDLVGAVDVLPTLCAAAGVTVPADAQIDGRSFLPQLCGERGSPREWLYCWFNPAGGAKPRFEFAYDHTFKLYVDGRFFNMQHDDQERAPLTESGLDDTAKAAKAKLRAVLEEFKGPRPGHVAEQYDPTNEADDVLDHGYGQGDTGKNRVRRTK